VQASRFLKHGSALIIVLVLMVQLMKYALNEQTYWHDVSGQGLNAKIQTGLTQMYWQWQGNGRADNIEYWPQNADQAFTIQMNNKGLPVVTKDKSGCLQFLYWFIDKKLLNKSVNVTTTYIPAQANVDGAGNKNMKSGIESSMCQFQYADKFYTYDLNSGQLQFTH
jgi:hypothetical protein